MYQDFIGYDQALSVTLAAVSPLDGEEASLSALVGRIAAQDVFARVDVPSADVSLKDGYAVRADDVASPRTKPRLRVIGVASAGSPFDGIVQNGQAIRILSGAAIPAGATSVLAEEFVRLEGDFVIAESDASAGRNILLRGTDVANGRHIIDAGCPLTPAQVGLLAAAGHWRLPVVRRPKVAIIATGDELATPGQPLEAGQVYPSNLVTLTAWCAHFGCPTEQTVVPDDHAAIEQALSSALSAADVVLICGGAWHGERDLTGAVLEHLGWSRTYRHVRLGPGKAVSFGTCQGKVLFSLPGGPPSNQMAFLQLALPAILKLSGYQKPGLPTLLAQLGEDIRGQTDWTQFVEGVLLPSGVGYQFGPQKKSSRLQSMADAQAMVKIPEGIGMLAAGTRVSVQVLPGGLALATEPVNTPSQAAQPGDP